MPVDFHITKFSGNTKASKKALKSGRKPTTETKSEVCSGSVSLSSAKTNDGVVFFTTPFTPEILEAATTAFLPELTNEVDFILQAKHP